MIRSERIRTAPPATALQREYGAGRQRHRDSLPSELHCAFCKQAFAPGRSGKRYCSNKCRAGASMHRALIQGAWQSLQNPAFVDKLPIEEVPLWIDAVDLFRSRLIARLSPCLDEQGTVR